MAKKLAFDTLPKLLLKDGVAVADLSMIYGFVAEGTTEDNITFYLDPSLQRSVVINDEDIVHHVKVTKAQNPIGGTVIWVKNAASYLQENQPQIQQEPQQETQSQQYAEQFFQGDIYQQYVNTVQGNTIPKPKDVHIPICGCGKCGQ
ncbi:MAG: hypothetical protein AAF611_04710 [Bacteroidota bacterium]